MTNYVYPQLNHSEHRRCSACGKLMIKRMSTEIDSIIKEVVDDVEKKIPAKSWVWYCCCGNVETGGMLKGMPETTWVKQEWERVNNIRREE